MDLIMVSEPEQIRKIEASGDVDRLHVYETATLPWWVRTYFKATKFYDSDRDLWFFPFESDANPEFEKRRAYLEGQVSKGYRESDVRTIAELLNTGANDEALAHEMVQIVNRRFFGAEVPHAICHAAKHTVQSFGEAALPWKYSQGRKAQREIMGYCERNLGHDVHLVDVGHNIGEVVQATASALRRIKDNLETPIEEIFTLYAPTPQVPRIAIRASRLDGLLRFPTVVGKTIVIFKIGKAAAKTKDISFTFGTGRPERACVFAGFFLEFMADLQKVLQEEAAQKLG
jgi:hypothetical protein